MIFDRYKDLSMAGVVDVVGIVERNDLKLERTEECSLDKFRRFYHVACTLEDVVQGVYEEDDFDVARLINEGDELVRYFKNVIVDLDEVGIEVVFEFAGEVPRELVPATTRFYNMVGDGEMSYVYMIANLEFDTAGIDELLDRLRDN